MYVMLINIYFICLYIPTYYLFIVIYIIIYYEKFANSCYQMNTELNHKELLQLWTQRKYEHTYIRSEHFRNSDIQMQRYVCF